ncbi:MAG: Maf family protein [Rhodoblastus sp.]
MLASKSAGRARVLRDAGLPFEAVDSALDEREEPAVDVLEPLEQAIHLARKKAQIVSARRPGRIVLGADQTLAFQGQTIHKARDLEDGLVKLRKLNGATHHLHSAVAAVRDGTVLFEFAETAEIRMRQVGDRALCAYARAMGEAFLATVGGYEIEGFGANLLESVSGDMFTVIGMPLFPLLAELRRIGEIKEDIEI